MTFLTQALALAKNGHLPGLLLCLLGLFLFSGCDSSQTTINSREGSAVFNLEIQSPDKQTRADTPGSAMIQSAGAAANSGIDCIAHNISTINCKIYDSDGTILTEETFNCSRHEGKIENIPAGDDREIIIDAVSADNSLLYRGEKRGFSIPAWETTDLGTIELNWVAFSQADLAGKWQGHGLYTGNMHAWFYSTMTIDASGNGKETWVLSDGNSDTTTTSQLKINKDGAITSPSKTTLHGALSIDKNIMTLTGTYPEDDDGSYLLMNYVKGGGSFAQSDLEGTWYGHSLMSGDYSGWEYATLILDDAGNATYSSVESDGTEGIDENPGRLNISSEGILTHSDNSSFHGVMSSDKNILVATETGEEDYIFHVFVKGGGDFTDMKWANTKWYGHGLFSGVNENWIYQTMVHDASGNGSVYYVMSNGDSGTTAIEPDYFSSEGILTSPSSPGHGVLSSDKNIMIYTETYGEFNDNYLLTIYTCQGERDAQFHPVYRSSVNSLSEYFSDGSPEKYYMAAGSIITDHYYDVRVTNVPNSAGDVKLMYYPGWSDFYPHLFVLGFTAENGYPAPGNTYEGTEYTFYIDKNGNGSLDAGEPSESLSLPENSIKKLGSVGQVTITQGKTPTITWEGIDTSATLSYRIMLFPADAAGAVNKGDLLFISDDVNPDSANAFSYTYTGNLFDENETLYIAIDAIEANDGVIVNRSRYYQKHDSL